MTAIKKLAAAAFTAATLMAVPFVSGCSSGSVGSISNAPAKSTVSVVKSHSFCTDYPDTAFEDIINKFVDDPVWKSTAKNGADIITVSGTMKDVGKPLYIEVSVKDDPEDSGMYLLDVEYVEFGNLISTSVDDAWGYMLDFYDYYGAGAENLTEYNTERMDWVMYLCPLEEGYVWIDAPYLTKDEYGNLAIAGVIMNESGKDKSAAINFIYYDNEGYQAGTAVDFIDSLKPGNKWKFSAALLFAEEISKWEFESFTTIGL